MAGSRSGRGPAANWVSSRPVVAAVRFPRNHGGFGKMVSQRLRTERGKGRNGPRATDFFTESSSSALCTRPAPEPMSCGVPPG